MLSWTRSILDQIRVSDISTKIAAANCVLTFFFLFATVVSVVCAFKAYNHQKNRARKEAACELARYYAEKIIPRNSFVMSAMKATKLEDWTKELFPYEELTEFNREEMIGFLSKNDADYSQVKTAFLQPDPKAIFWVKYRYLDSVEARQSLFNGHFKSDVEAEEPQLVNSELLQIEFVSKALAFLNDLEWFSMSCRYGISDEELLYQSLHQTFLSSVWLLYFYICDENLTNENKLFTNIIWLFKAWHTRLMKKEQETERKRYLAKIKIAEGERELREAKSEVYAGEPLKK